MAQDPIQEKIMQGKALSVSEGRILLNGLDKPKQKDEKKDQRAEKCCGMKMRWECDVFKVEKIIRTYLCLGCERRVNVEI